MGHISASEEANRSLFHAESYEVPFKSDDSDMWDKILPLVGVVVGGLITIPITLLIERRKTRVQEELRRTERAEVAARDIASSLMEMYSAQKSNLLVAEVSNVDELRIEKEVRERIMLDILWLRNENARVRIEQIIDLIGWSALVGEYGKQLCLEHLIACCGCIMRGEEIPKIPTGIQGFIDALEEHLKLQNEGR